MKQVDFLTSIILTTKNVLIWQPCIVTSNSFISNLASHVFTSKINSTAGEAYQLVVHVFLISGVSLAALLCAVNSGGKERKKHHLRRLLVH